MKWVDIPTLPQSEYTYSKPIVIKKWSSGQIIAQVGYVRKHPENNSICLLKSWSAAGGVKEEQKYNIKKGDWPGIKDAIEKLLPEIGEKPTADGIDSAIKKISQESELLEIFARYPDLLTQVPNDVDILALPEDQKEALKRLLSTGGLIANSVIVKLAEQPIRDLEHFSKLLDNLKLSTINSLVTHVTGRINFIEMFEKVIHDDSSYEKKGDDSVHNLLRANIWLIDRNYAVLHDDETLKNIIATQWKKDTQDNNSNRRPDFLCMTDRHNQENGYKNLVIIEIKRPSIEINLEHIEQIMSYKGLLQKYSGTSGNPKFICYIVGREINETLQQNPLHESGFITKTYTDFIGDARKFYHDYLEIIKAEKYAF
ncbi:MAG TPA: hypothetical protein VLF93_05890 [Candidatus Saccharimonadales bacterium]|nr:hypothetical protein [Candidatus Saccharimonadales bacterium]